MEHFDTSLRPANLSGSIMSRPEWMTPANRFNRGFDQQGLKPVSGGAANQNSGAPEFSMLNQLPGMIADAITEWALSLKGQNWRLRRRALSRFSQAFADQFLALDPDLGDEAYGNLVEIGYTCLLELLDNGQPIAGLEQALCFAKSLHRTHREAAEIFLSVNDAPGVTTLH